MFSFKVFIDKYNLDVLTLFVPLLVRPCEKMTVVLGAHNIRKKEKSQQLIQVAEYIPHPEYTGECDNDIMLLKVNKSMQKFI